MFQVQPSSDPLLSSYPSPSSLSFLQALRSSFRTCKWVLWGCLHIALCFNNIYKIQQNVWLRCYASGAKSLFCFPSLSYPRGFPFFALLKSAFSSSIWDWRRKGKCVRQFKKSQSYWQKLLLITCSRNQTFNSSIFSFSLVIWDSCDFETLRWWLQIMATWVYKKGQPKVRTNDDTSS